MLHDPKCDPLPIRILDWLRDQPPNQLYDWHDDKNCPCAKFGGREVWRYLDTLAGYQPWTYGALLDRASEKFLLK